MEKEIFKPIVGYEGYYEISNKGNVKSLDRLNNRGFKSKGKILKLSFSNHQGYVRIDLVKNRKRMQYSVHRLVAKAFISNPLNLPEVNHLDLNKRNNSVENLEWSNRLDNVRHGIINGKPRNYNPQRGEEKENSILTEEKVKNIRLLYSSGDYCYNDICKMFEIKLTTAYKVINGITWKHIVISTALKEKIRQVKIKNFSEHPRLRINGKII